MEIVTQPTELMLVMPVYNEQASVKKVVTEWIEEISNWTDNFILFVINDGSTDDSLKILQKLQARFGDHLEILNNKNRGHGQSCLIGYKEAAKRGVPWIFQLDSDGQCSPEYFYRLWREREKYDILYGVRNRRDDGIKRVMASMVLRLFLLIFFRSWCPDANVPYRLMRTSSIMEAVKCIPQKFFLANVGLSLLLKKNRFLRHYYVYIRFRERYGGEPSVRLSLFGKKAKELYQELNLLINRKK